MWCIQNDYEKKKSQVNVLKKVSDMLTLGFTRLTKGFKDLVSYPRQSKLAFLVLGKRQKQYPPKENFLTKSDFRGVKS